ncbi:hypothetical protein [Streptomyces klenkii]
MTGPRWWRARPRRQPHGQSDLIGALVETGERPARIRDTVMVTMLATT